jgi:uncharacterized protein
MNMNSTSLIKPVRYRRRTRNKWLRLSVVLVVLLLLAVPLISGFVGWSLTHPAHKPIEATPRSVGAVYQDVSFASTDGTTLRGWFLPAGDNSRVVVFAHGYRGNRADKPALPTAKSLVDSGISVLLFDFRNSGESDGKLTTVGALEKDDLISAVKFMESKGYGKQGIGLIGFSMGAATSLVAVADLPEVKAVIADSPFADLTTYLHENMPYWTHLPDFPFTNVILWELPKMIGFSTDEVSPVLAAPKLRDRPILLIHGTGDKAISMHNSEKIKAALNNPTDELWTVEAAQHVGTFDLVPIEYEKRVVDFFQQHLGGANGKL